MSVILKAQELGEAISESSELMEMKATQDAMLGNEAASKIINEFNEKQRTYLEIQRQGLQLSDLQKSDVQDMEKRMLENDLVVAFFKAQQNFEKMLEQINQIISKSITGESSSCTDECCTSCSGCGVQ